MTLKTKKMINFTIWRTLLLQPEQLRRKDHKPKGSKSKWQYFMWPRILRLYLFLGQSLLSLECTFLYKNSAFFRGGLLQDRRFDQEGIKKQLHSRKTSLKVIKLQDWAKCFNILNNYGVLWIKLLIWLYDKWSTM